MSLVGDKAFIARLRRAAKVASAMNEWANESAEIIAQEARSLVDEGGIPSPNHIPSDPGQSPNTDSGKMVAHINAEDLPETGQAAVISDAMSDSWYSYALIEFGNSRVAERPYMRPATSNKRKVVLANARTAVNKVIR